MDKRIIYSTDEGVGIITPALQTKGVNENMTDFLLRIAKKTVPKGARWEIIDASKIPLDKTFRDSWELVREGMEEME